MQAAQPTINSIEKSEPMAKKDLSKEFQPIPHRATLKQGGTTKHKKTKTTVSPGKQQGKHGGTNGKNSKYKFIQ